MIQTVLRKLIGTRNERELRKIQPIVARVNAFGDRIEKMSAADMQARIGALREEVSRGQSLDAILPEVFALTREAGKRALGLRHYDVQLIGGAVLHSGRIAEMRTGEGKTLVATLPAVLNALSGRGVHVVTVNDYLARRDAEQMGRLYGYLGLSTGVVVHGLSDQQRQLAYRSDITYGQNNEFGFDYLRDNMKMRLRDYVQRELNYAIVDEVDSILIDEARTPLIISGPSEESTELYGVVNRVIPALVRDRDYTVDEKDRRVSFTEAGIEHVEKLLQVPNLYAPEAIEALHHVEQALRAHTLYKKDVHYVIKEGEVLIVDEHTGRTMPGRRWSDGLHQSIEAKEGVEVQAENQTLATISFQNYFRMYSKLSGMTGTAETEVEEFSKIYSLEVTVVPTHRPMVRKDHQDVVYKTEREKFTAVVDEIAECHEKGQPVLVGTASIAKSEAISHLLKKRGITHNVLNAKHHEREAEIIAQAGRKGAVTIATNMAGRGTDILLGGNAEALARMQVGAHPPERQYVADPNATGPVSMPMPEPLEQWQARVADWEKAVHEATARIAAEVEAERNDVRSLGGLHILGTERHESRRIDNQLRGRAGRQGDPGTSRFYLSLEDDLMRIFASDRIAWLMDRMGMPDNEPIEHPMLTRSIASAQQRVEGQYFDMRKALLEYDDVMNQQRKSIYKLRRQVLAAGAGIPLVEYEENPTTRVKTRLEQNVDWKDLRERVLDTIEDVVLATVDEGVPRRREDWDPARLTALVQERFGLALSFTDVGPDPEALQLRIFQAVEQVYLDKARKVGDDRFAQAEQWFYLQNIDTLWKDHLLTMDHLRQGIGLRGYGQKDPKQEYKREGFKLFQVLMSRMSKSVVSTILRLEPVSEDDAAIAEQRRLAEARVRRLQEAANQSGEESHSQRVSGAAEAPPAAPPQRGARSQTQTMTLTIKVPARSAGTTITSTGMPAARRAPPAGPPGGSVE